MLSAAHDGIETDEAGSWRYMTYIWRKEMHADYQTMRDTPLDVIKADLEYMGLEAQIRKAKSS